MKIKIISLLTLLLLISWSLSAQKQVVHISQLEKLNDIKAIPDVEGFLLVDRQEQIPFQTNIFREGIEVMEGWPVNESGPTNRGGVFGNLDDDPELETIYNIGNKTYAFNTDGTYVEGWPKSVSSSPQYGAPAYGDIDGDGYEEIVVNCRIVGTGNSGKVYAFEKDGSPVSGFPVTAAGGPTRTPVLADLDGDGAMEIIIELRDYPDGYVCVYHGDGSIMEGWPVALDYIPGSAAAVGDITGDGIPEIIAESYYKVWAFDINGIALEGFPYEPGAGRVFSYSSPVMADMDDDGIREILVGDHSTSSGNGAVHIIKNNGTSLEGWPKFSSNWIYGPVSVADIDNDGSPDVIVGDQVLSGVPSNYVYGWNNAGVNLEGFPIGPLWAINSQIIIADLDGDDLPELMFDDNTGAGIYQGYNNDGTEMEGWPIDVEGTSFFINPFVTDMTGDGMLNLNGGGYVSDNNQSWIYLWNSDVPFNRDLAVLPVLQYNVRHTGVMGENTNPVVGLEDATTDFSTEITCYPNPCTDYCNITLKGNLNQVQDISVYDGFGREILTLTVSDSRNDRVIFNTQYLARGIYFLKVNGTGSHGGISKLLVQ